MADQRDTFARSPGSTPPTQSSQDHSTTTRHMIWLMLRARIKAQLQYRTSFWLDFCGQALLGITEFVEIYVLITVAPVLGGVSRSQIVLIYGMSACAFGVADMIFGQLDTTNRLIKKGQLEVLLTRPVSLLIQLITQDVQLRRLARSLLGLGALLGGCWWAGVEPSLRNIALITLAVVGGTLIFGALFLFAGSMLFFILDGDQAVNAATYGGRYASSFPGSALREPIRSLFTFVVPATLIAYVPAMMISGGTLPNPWWAPTAWLTVPIGIIMWAVLLLFWRQAIRHYTGAGG